MNAWNTTLAKLGLSEIDTGGGCTALATPTPDGGRVLITTDNAQAPAGLGTKGLTIGFYDKADTLIGFVQIAGNLASIQALG